MFTDYGPGAELRYSIGFYSLAICLLNFVVNLYFMMKESISNLIGTCKNYCARRKLIAKKHAEAAYNIDDSKKGPYDNSIFLIHNTSQLDDLLEKEQIPT